MAHILRLSCHYVPVYLVPHDSRLLHHIQDRPAVLPGVDLRAVLPPVHGHIPMAAVNALVFRDPCWLHESSEG